MALDTGLQWPQILACLRGGKKVPWLLPSAVSEGFMWVDAVAGPKAWGVSVRIGQGPKSLPKAITPRPVPIPRRSPGQNLSLALPALFPASPVHPGHISVGL